MSLAVYKVKFWFLIAKKKIELDYNVVPSVTSPSLSILGGKVFFAHSPDIQGNL